MKKHTIQATTRTQTGRKAKQVRAEGHIPATIYGKHTENCAIQIAADAFLHTFHETGETGLIEIVVEEKTHPVLVKQIQVHPVTSDILHVEFLEVNLKEKIKANVPVVLEGESPAVKEGVGMLLHLINEIEVEALPAELPEHIVIDVASLVALNDQVLVKQLPIPNGVTLLTDPEIIVVKIGELVAPEPEPEPAGEVTPEEGKSEETPSESTESETTSPESATKE